MCHVNAEDSQSPAGNSVELRRKDQDKVKLLCIEWGIHSC